MRQNLFGRRDPNLRAVKEKTFDQKMMESIVPTHSKESKARRIKHRNLCIGATVVIAAIVGIVLLVIDGRMPEPGIELPMIKEYNAVPTGLTAKQYNKMVDWLNDG
jgi:hypothetical protein